jgi:hypothetical protein
MKTRPNRNLGAAARNRIFTFSRMKCDCKGSYKNEESGKTPGRKTPQPAQKFHDG